jgi:hypothetical protein
MSDFIAEKALRNIQRGGATPNLLFALWIALNCCISEPRDAAYALPNLLRSEHDTVPNYQLPTRDVYMDYAVKAIYKKLATLTFWLLLRISTPAVIDLMRLCCLLWCLISSRWKSLDTWTGKK